GVRLVRWVRWAARRGVSAATPPSLPATIAPRCATSCRCGSGPASRSGATAASPGYHRATRRDQRSLRLEPDVPVLPNLPTTLRPMLPRPLAEPFDSQAHLFEPSWGGLRALAFIGAAGA